MMKSVNQRNYTYVMFYVFSLLSELPCVHLLCVSRVVYFASRCKRPGESCSANTPSLVATVVKVNFFSVYRISGSHRRYSMKPEAPLADVCVKNSRRKCRLHRIVYNLQIQGKQICHNRRRS